MDFSYPNLMALLVFSVIGMAIFRHAYKRGNFKMLAVGLALLIYPYFISSALANWSVGLALCGLAYFIHRYFG